MIKKWIKRAAAAAACLLILFFGADLLLRWVSSSDWARARAEKEASAFLHRDVRLKKMSASFMGVKLDGLEISEAGGFDKGTFLSAERVRVRVRFRSLLLGRLRIISFTLNGGEVNLSRGQDGAFNWEGLFPQAVKDSSPQEPSHELPFPITLRQLTVQHFNVSFNDLQTNTRAAASDISLVVRRFAFRREFSLRLATELTYEKEDKIFTVPVSLAAGAFLRNLDFSHAYVNVTNLSAQYEGASLQVKLRADDFISPSVKAQLELKDLSSDALGSLFPQLPQFALSRATVETNLKIDPRKQTVQADSFSFTMPGAETHFSGSLYYGTEKQYAFDSSFNLNIGELFKLLPELAEAYRPSGLLEGKAAWGPDGADASVTLAQGSVRVPYTGEFTEVTASFASQENPSFDTGRAEGYFAGLLNGEKFEGKLTIDQTPKAVDADVMLRAGRVALPPVAEAADPTEEPKFVDDTKLVTVEKTDWPLPPINVRADIKIGSLDAPYVYGTDIAFRSKLTGVTPDLKQTYGELSLSMGGGEIKDLYRLTNANAVTKVLFLSVNVVGKVFNSMNVFAVLDGLGSGLLNVMGAGAAPEEKEEDHVVQTVIGPDGTPVQIMVPYSERKIDGKMPYDKFATDVNFHSGVADMRGGTFVSDVVSFTLDGTTDFNTGALDMTVQAAPGKHEADGIMPLTMKVGGTVSEPKGSMSLIGSMSSLVTQGLSNNFASRSVKKGLGGLFGLFKKKKEEPQPAAAEAAASGQNPAATQTQVPSGTEQGNTPPAEASTPTTVPSQGNPSAEPAVK